ncbi:MAG: sigma-70 family RNA polymerase sigma factor [Firmicutes bacterium]|nr:sigma-70 family RNA polymerase sigma factor [Bacillota bacterium]
MKSPYKFYDGKTSELEVNPAVAELLADFEREDENEARKARWRKEISLDALYEETEWEPTDTTVHIEADYIAKEEKETLLAGVAGLSEKQRRLVRLYYYEEKTECEIAAILGVSQQAVSQQLSTIKTALKKYFDKFSD